MILFSNKHISVTLFNIKISIYFAINIKHRIKDDIPKNMYVKKKKIGNPSIDKLFSGENIIINKKIIYVDKIIAKF